jgi:hypothetical protein
LWVTSIPQSVSEWPPKYFEPLYNTTSAPKANGFDNGGGASVESTRSSDPAEHCRTFLASGHAEVGLLSVREPLHPESDRKHHITQQAWISRHSPVGFTGVSSQTSTLNPLSGRGYESSRSITLTSTEFLSFIPLNWQ